MDNVRSTSSTSSCFLCQDAQAPDSTPPADADIVKCARGHAFHRNCLIQLDCFRRCPQTDCNAHIPCFVKPLADRLARSLLPYMGLDELLDRVVRADTQQTGVSPGICPAIRFRVGDFIGVPPANAARIDELCNL